MQGRKHRKGSVSKYSLSYRQQVAQDYLNGDLSYAQVAQKYDLPGKETVRDWVRTFRESVDIASEEPVAMPKNTEDKRVPDERDLRIRELEQLLEHERLRSLAYSTMIDVAEEELGVSIRKKPGSRQSRG